MNASRADLSGITVCAATSVNVAATVRALTHTLAVARVDAALLFTDGRPPELPETVRCIPIGPLRSTMDYSQFILHELHRWVETDHCLIVQWDGYPRHAAAWDQRFRQFDYIGAPWPQFNDGHDVGNGGFSFRSRKLLQACRDPRFQNNGSPEDLVIARQNREFLEREYAIRFADTKTAACFSIERPMGSGRDHRELLSRAFGFHGVFNMIDILGTHEFGEVYRSLDHRAPLGRDLWQTVLQLSRSREGRQLALEMLRDRAAGRLG